MEEVTINMTIAVMMVNLACHEVVYLDQAKKKRAYLTRTGVFVNTRNMQEFVFLVFSRLLKSTYSMWLRLRYGARIMLGVTAGSISIRLQQCCPLGILLSVKPRAPFLPPCLISNSDLIQFHPTYGIRAV